MDNLNNLKELNLSYNKIVEFLPKLPNLKKLCLKHNRLSKIPTSITQVNNLETLDLSYNNIYVIHDTP